MLKADQIQFIALNAGILKSEAEKALKQTGEMVRASLSGADGKPTVGNKVKIDGLGTFEVVKTAARKGTNPQVAAAKKAVEAGTPDDKQVQLLQAVQNGLVKEFYETAEGLAIKFRPEAAMKAWSGGEEEEEIVESGSAPEVVIV